MRLTQLGSWALALLTSGALMLASWCLYQVATLDKRVAVVEQVQKTHSSVLNNATELKERVAILEKAQLLAANELSDVEKSGSNSFKVHDTLDQQRDMELRTRISRTESAIDKLAAASEKISVIQNDVAWIKDEIARAKKP